MKAGPVVRVLDETGMGKTTPDFPMFVPNGNRDELIRVGPVNTLVSTYCRDPDAHACYTREHLGEHAITELTGTAPAILWLKDRLDGVRAAVADRRTRRTLSATLQQLVIV